MDSSPENNMSTQKRRLEAEETAETKKPKASLDSEDSAGEAAVSNAPVVTEKTDELSEKKTASKETENTPDNEENGPGSKGRDPQNTDNAAKTAENDPKNTINTNISAIAAPSETATKEDAPKATFGGTLFPASFKTKPIGDQPKAAAPSHVFGATSSFGTSLMDKLKAKPSVFEGLPSQSSTISDSGDVTPAASAQPSFGSSFGSKSAFGNAFQESLKKKSFLDDDGDKTDTDTPKKDDSAAPQQYKQVELAIKDTKTGEEDEESQFSTTTKIFELNLAKISEGWKERGVGPLHLNQSKTDRSQLRLVMRSQGLLRVVLNMKITPSTVLLKGLEASLSPGKFLRLNSVSEGRPVQYLLKFGSENTRNELYDTVERLKGEIKDKKEDKKDDKKDDKKEKEKEEEK